MHIPSHKVRANLWQVEGFVETFSADEAAPDWKIHMTNEVESRLHALGIELPVPAAPIANYVPAVRSSQHLFISGQLPLENGTVAITGLLGGGVELQEGRRAARLCAIALLAQAKMALEGDLSRIRRLVRLGGFVAVAPGFHDIPQVIDGASDLMVEVLGESGRHARAAVGVAGLPRNAAVEIDAVFEIA